MARSQLSGSNQRAPSHTVRKNTSNSPGIKSDSCSLRAEPATTSLPAADSLISHLKPTAQHNEEHDPTSKSPRVVTFNSQGAVVELASTEAPKSEGGVHWAKTKSGGVVINQIDPIVSNASPHNSAIFNTAGDKRLSASDAPVLKTSHHPVTELLAKCQEDLAVIRSPILITDAWYGTSPAHCMNVTEHMTKMLKQIGFVIVPQDSNLFFGGDPVIGKLKMTRIELEQHGRKLSLVVDEGQELVYPTFADKVKVFALLECYKKRS